MKKRLFACGISAVMLTSALSAMPALPVSAANDYTQTRFGDYEARFYADHAEITRYWGDDSDVAVPSELNGLPVTALGYQAFAKAVSYNDKIITSVTLPETVTYIDGWCFSGCKDLVSVTLPDSLTEVGKNSVFENCTALEHVNLPKNLKKLSTSMFKNCTSLKEITIPGNISYVEDYAFWDCTALERITLEEGVQEIGSSAFSGCNAVTDVTFPESIRSIGFYAFSSDCPFEKQILASDEPCIIQHMLYRARKVQGDYTVPDGVKYIAADAFRENQDITSVTVPESVEQIYPYAFFGCSGLTAANIRGQITVLDSVFYNCRKLSKVTLPDTLKTIGERAFDNCNALSSVTIPAGVETIGPNAFTGTALTAVELPESLREIGESAFGGLPLTSITLPEGLEMIGADAFGYTNLEELTIPESVQHIGDGAFSGIRISSLTLPNRDIDYGVSVFSLCRSLKTITVPNKVSAIPTSMFASCTSLEEVNLRYGLTEIGKEAFYHCGALTEIKVPESVEVIGDEAFIECGKLTAVTIIDGLREIGAGAFNGTGISTIRLPKTLESIGENAFSGSALKAVTVADGIRSIDDGVFAACAKLEEVSLPDSVESIGKRAFTDCTALQHITIPDSVTSIGENAFYNSGLQTVDMSDNVEFLGRYAFGFTDWLENTRAAAIASGDMIICGKSILECSGCSGDVVIPDGIVSICETAFQINYGNTGADDSGIRSITSVQLPDTLTRIEEYTFQSLTQLKEITIPASVSYIGMGAFNYCESLESITVLNPDCDLFQTYAGQKERMVYNGYNGLDGYFYNGVIKGYSGSTAQEMAEHFGDTFVSLGDYVPVKGDMNADGIVRAADAVLLMRFIAEDSTLTEAQLNALYRAELDLNGDGVVTVKDADTLMGMLAANGQS